MNGMHEFSLSELQTQYPPNTLRFSRGLLTINAVEHDFRRIKEDSCC